MSFYWGFITPMNLVFCVLILFLGLKRHRKDKNRLPLFIGIAFILFGVSHILALVNFGNHCETVLIAARVSAYLLIVYALMKD